MVHLAKRPGPAQVRGQQSSSPPRNLSRGVRGSDVRSLQNRLRGQGYPIKADGIFGPRTERAVRAFQTASQIKIDGIVGPETRGALRDATQHVTPSPEPSRVGTGSASAFDRVLGGALRGQGQAFIDAGQRYGVNPRLLAAIAMHETGNGTSRFARQLNNVGGIMDPKHNWQRGKRFASLDEGIQYMARNLRKNYLDKGLRTLEQIQRKYAPVGARNDPRSLNRHWVSGVSKYLKQLGG